MVSFPLSVGAPSYSNIYLFLQSTSAHTDDVRGGKCARSLFFCYCLYTPHSSFWNKRPKQLDKPSEHYVVRRRTARRLDRVRPTYDTERTANEKWERNKREKNERRRSGQQGKPLHFALLRFPPSPAPRFPQWRRPGREKEERLELGACVLFRGEVGHSNSLFFGSLGVWINLFYLPYPTPETLSVIPSFAQLLACWAFAFGIGGGHLCFIPLYWCYQLTC